MRDVKITDCIASQLPALANVTGIRLSADAMDCITTICLLFGHETLVTLEQSVQDNVTIMTIQFSVSETESMAKEKAFLAFEAAVANTGFSIDITGDTPVNVKLTKAKKLEAVYVKAPEQEEKIPEAAKPEPVQPPKEETQATEAAAPEAETEVPPEQVSEKKANWKTFVRTAVDVAVVGAVVYYGYKWLTKPTSV